MLYTYVCTYVCTYVLDPSWCGGNVRTCSVDCEYHAYLCSLPVCSDQRMDAVVDAREQLEQSRVMVHGLQQEVGAPVVALQCGTQCLWCVLVHLLVCPEIGENGNKRLLTA